MVETKRTPVIWILFLAIQLLVGCRGASANSPAFIDDDNSSGDKRASRQLAPLPQDGDTAAGHKARDGDSELPVSYSACLKEGEACNPLNDKCCPKYWCFGGLVPTCMRKP